MNWYKATCLKEIYWKGKTYRSGDTINIIEEDVRILMQAGVVGGARKIQEKEFAVREVPENAMKTHRKGRKKGNS